MGLFGFGKKKGESIKADIVKEKVQEKESVEPKFEGHLTVRIFCSAGASTSLWARNVQKAMDEKGLDAEIRAYSTSVVYEEGVKADVILIGPQTRYVEQDVKNKFPEKKVAVVPVQIFGLMNGEKGLEFIISLL
ncbi:PTS system, cellobiose-specific IIB component [Paenibacillus sophorae]|nr:PTS system, cellobiose-specific IIB component [Paenibacillus sophorae]